MKAIRGVLLHESVLIRENEHVLSPHAEKLLIRLQHSKLRTGIACMGAVTQLKEMVIRHMGDSYEPWMINIDELCPENALKEACLTWDATPDECVFVASELNEKISHKVFGEGWGLVIQDVGNSHTMSKMPGVMIIHDLHDLLIKLLHRNKEVFGNSVLTVGYVMKWTREKDFLKRGALPLLPADNGLVFVAIDLSLQLAPQLEKVDLVLHKMTDEISSISIQQPSCLPAVTFSKEMQQLQSCIKQMQLSMIDAVQDIIPLLDRVATLALLKDVVEVNNVQNCRIRIPQFLKVTCFDGLELHEELRQAQISLPAIVKPQIACGVASAHKMAIIFKMEEFSRLPVPLPAVIQEYVDHESVVYKLYVLGEKVFYAVRTSTPDAAVLLQSANSENASVVFDSLKALPVGPCTNPKGASDTLKLDLAIVSAAAIWIKKKLHLTIFGFDVVVQAGTMDHVIIDVNYLPSFKEIQDELAIPAFWDAIKGSYGTH